MSAESFLHGFHDYLCTRTDAPPNWHLSAGLATIAVALCGGAESVYADGRGREIYPNLWVINIGGSGMGKSIPLDMSRRFLHQAGLNDHVAAESFSLEAMYTVLQKEPCRIFYLQEFSAFMGMLGRDYNAGAMPALTEWYDGPELFKRDLVKGPIEIKRPRLTLLSASSPQWFAEQFKPGAQEGGFLNRFLFYPETVRGAYVADPGPFDEAIETPLSDHLRRVAELYGPAHFGRVRQEFAAWEYANRLRMDERNPKFAGMHSRAETLVKKIAMIFQASIEPDHFPLTIGDWALRQAIGHVEGAISRAENYIETKVAVSRGDAERILIRETVERWSEPTGYAPANEVLRRSKLDSKTFWLHVSTLCESGVLRQARSKAKNGADRKWIGLVDPDAPVPAPVEAAPTANGATVHARD